MSEPPVYIAGVGLSPWTWPRNALPAMKTSGAAHQLALSAGVKALLDAGVSYDEVDQAIGCGDLKGDNEVFYIFGKTGIPIYEVANETGLYAASQFIKSGNTNCVLVIGLDQHAAVGVVLASDAFIWRHPYLKDASVAIPGCALGTPTKGTPTMKFVTKAALKNANLSPSDIQLLESNEKSTINDLGLKRIRTWSSTSSLTGLCEIVWLLRGWGWNDSAPKTKNCLQCSLSSNGTATATIFARYDGKEAPAFKTVEHKNDGRDRLGYNPAAETKEISVEDWESVKAREEYTDERAVDSVRFRRKGGDRAALAKL